VAPTAYPRPTMSWDEQLGLVTRAFDEWKLADRDIRVFLGLSNEFAQKEYKRTWDEFENSRVIQTIRTFQPLRQRGGGSVASRVRVDDALIGGEGRGHGLRGVPGEGGKRSAEGSRAGGPEGAGAAPTPTGATSGPSIRTTSV
jgi:hypothetical protein